MARWSTLSSNVARFLETGPYWPGLRTRSLRNMLPQDGRSPVGRVSLTICDTHVLPPPLVAKKSNDEGFDFELLEICAGREDLNR